MEFIPSTEAFARIFRSEEWPDVNLAERLILKRIDTIKRHTSDLYAMISDAEEVDSVKPYWIEELDYPHELIGTLGAAGEFTVTGKLFGQDPTPALIAKVARLYATLRHDTGGVTSIVYVSAVDGTDPKLTFTATSGTSLPAQSTGQRWVLTGEPATDAEDASNPRWLDRDFFYTTSELFTDMFTIELTRKGTRMVAVPDELARQLNALLVRQEDLIARACLTQWPEVTAGGEPKSTMEIERSRLCGMDWWPHYFFGTGQKHENGNLLVNLSGKRFDQKHIDAVVAAGDAAGFKFNQGTWRLVSTPTIIDTMQNFGMIYRTVDQNSTTAGWNIDVVRTKRGVDVRPMRDWYMPDGCAYLVDASKLKKHPFKGMGFLKGLLGRNNVTSEQWQIARRKVGLVIRRGPVSIAKFSGIGS